MRLKRSTLGVLLNVGLLSSLIGFIVQSYQVSVQYFEYETVTFLEFRQPSQLNPPTWIICFLKWQLVGSYRGWNDDEFYANIRTVADLWNNSPSVDEFLNDFMIRDNYYFKQGLHSNSLLVRKVLKQQFVCYSFTIQNLVFRFTEMTNGLIAPKFYRLVLNDRLMTRCPSVFSFLRKDFHDFYGVSHGLTRLDRGFTTASTKHFGRGRGNHFEGHVSNRTKRSLSRVSLKKPQEKNFLTLSYHKLNMELLSYPYKTNCFDYATHNTTSRGFCFHSCSRQQTLEKLKKVNFALVMTQPEDIETVNYTHFANETFAKVFKKITLDCKKRCARSDCVSTDVIASRVSEQMSENATFELWAPNKAFTYATVSPRITMVDFITYLLSCASFWLGFSPQSLFETLPNAINGKTIKKRKTSKVKPISDLQTQTQSKQSEMIRLVDMVDRLQKTVWLQEKRLNVTNEKLTREAESLNDQLDKLRHALLL